MGSGVNAGPLSDSEVGAAYEAMESAIRTYFETVWRKTGVSEPGEYIGDWIVVAEFGSLIERDSSGYVLEASMDGHAPPHVIRGLLGQGVRWLDDAESGGLE